MAPGSWQRCSDDSLGEEDVQVEDEARFQLKPATGMDIHLYTQKKILLRNCSLKQEATFVLNFIGLLVCPMGSHSLAMWWSLFLGCVLGCLLKAL